MKSEILRLLKESDTYISGQQLCEQFQVSRTAIWKVIDQLKKEGYEIEAVRNKGYRLIDSPDVMSKAEIESLVDTKWAGKNVVYYDEIDSTNNRAKEAGDNGAAHGRKRPQRPCLEITVRKQYLYDDPVVSGYSAGKGTTAYVTYGDRCGRRYPGSDRT